MIKASHPSKIPEPDEQYLSAGGDFLDSQLETADKIEIGRVADIEAEWHEDGRLVLCAILTGPQTLAHRIARPLGTFLQWIFHGHFDHAIPMSELANVELILHLRSNAIHYPTGQSERWLIHHILRWIPGNGYKNTGAGKNKRSLKQITYNRTNNARIVRIEELFGSRIVTHEGKRVGHIFDLQVSRGPEYEVLSIVYGSFALLYRMHVLHPFAHMLHLSREPETVAWRQVDSFEHKTVTLKNS